MMESNLEFLTVEECQQVDAALLTSRDKFTARVSIYALRSLKTIASQQSQTHQSSIQIADLQSETIVTWINSDPSLQANQDEVFRKFFAQIVLGALKPLTEIASQLERTIDDLTVSDVITWYEAKAKGDLTIPE